jgi:hypothetical protein
MELTDGQILAESDEEGDPLALHPDGVSVGP